MPLVKSLFSCLIMLISFIFLTGFVYPALVTGVAQLAFYDKANGQLIRKEGRVIGSVNVGQFFTKPIYFWGRPSATIPPYNASSSAASNLSPANKKQLELIAERIKRIKEASPENETPIPIDLLTASGSGLDPHISLAAAEYQIIRVAKNRKLTEQQVRELVNQHTEQGFLDYGQPRVNVLLLNMALDKLSADKKQGNDKG